MATTNFNPNFFSGAGIRLPLAGGQDFPVGGISVSTAEEAERNLSYSEGQSSQAETASAAFTSTCALMAAHHAKERQDCRNAPRPQAKGKGATSLADGEKGSFFALPQLTAERIFHLLSLPDKKAFSTTCKAFRALSLACYQQRCSELLRSDARNHFFARFGIHCPAGRAPRHEHMDAMITRIEAIMHLMEGVLANFPQCPQRCGYTAEALVLQLPAQHLQALLETAYQCNLYKIFSPFVTPPVAHTLGVASNNIQDWLHTDEPRKIRQLLLRNAGLSCLPFELNRLENVTVLDLRNNHLAALPGEIGQLGRLRCLFLDKNPFTTISTAIWQPMSDPAVLLTSKLSQKELLETRKLLGMARHLLLLARFLPSQGPHSGQQARAICEPSAAGPQQIQAATLPEIKPTGQDWAKCGPVLAMTQRLVAMTLQQAQEPQGEAQPDKLGRAMQTLLTLQRMSAALLRMQAWLELAQLQNCLEHVEDFAEGQAGLAQLAVFQPLVQGLASTIESATKIMKQLESPSTFEPQKVQTELDDVRCSLRQQQAMLWSMYDALSHGGSLPRDRPNTKAEAEVEEHGKIVGRDMVRKLQELTLHVVQLTTGLVELSELTEKLATATITTS